MAKKTKNGINIILGLAAVFLLILGTNRIDKRHFETAQNTIVSVYNDRVLAQDHIYKMNNLVHAKQALYTKGYPAESISKNKEIDLLVVLFGETKLTNRENKTFKSFKETLKDLEGKEAAFLNTMNVQFQNGMAAAIDQTTMINNNLDLLKSDLNNLALIQVSETKNLTSIAQKSLHVNQLMSTMEIYFLLVVGIIILIFTFYRIGKSKI